MNKIIEALKEKERKAREASENFNDSNSLYHEGRADAYGVAVAMLEEASNGTR